MTDLNDASEAGPPSHETSPPPAKRTRLSRAARTAAPAVSTSPPRTRIKSRKAPVMPPSSSTSVAEDPQVSSPSEILDPDPVVAAKDSRASSEIPVLGVSTRSKKRKADNMISVTPSVSEESDSQVTSSQNTGAESATVPNITVEPADDKLLMEPDQAATDLDQEATDVEAPTVSRRGRPPNRGRGWARGGRGGRGGNAATFSRANSAVPMQAKKPAGRGGRWGRGRGKISANNLVQGAYDRQSDLKKSYRDVARALKLGLDALATQSYEMVVTQPKYYKEVPEYDQTMRELDAKRNAVQGSHGLLYQQQVDCLKRKKELDDIYTRRVFEVSQIPTVLEKYY
jgi:hypothetical protein